MSGASTPYLATMGAAMLLCGCPLLAPDECSSSVCEGDLVAECGPRPGGDGARQIARRACPEQTTCAMLTRAGASEPSPMCVDRPRRACATAGKVSCEATATRVCTSLSEGASWIATDPCDPVAGRACGVDGACVAACPSDGHEECRGDTLARCHLDADGLVTWSSEACRKCRLDTDAYTCH